MELDLHIESEGRDREVVGLGSPLAPDTAKEPRGFNSSIRVSPLSVSVSRISMPMLALMLSLLRLK